MKKSASVISLVSLGVLLGGLMVYNRNAPILSFVFKDSFKDNKAEGSSLLSTDTTNKKEVKETAEVVAKSKGEKTNSENVSENGTSQTIPRTTQSLNNDLNEIKQDYDAHSLTSGCN